ncbi:MAG: hypothetical protein F6K03_07595 [Kamptonema sp. SIO4C4]|nr:hypothetical protein [Kamptonema sp. SIO4C4]
MAEQSEQAKKDALIRPKPPKAPPKEAEEKAQETTQAQSTHLSPPPSRPTPPKKTSGSKPSKPSRKPKKREKPPLILENDNLKAGDEISLPHTGKTVTVTHFHKSPSEVWFVLFDGGCVRQDILN